MAILSKRALAIWMGVFLVLPNCPCQLLKAFGIELPGAGFPESDGTPQLATKSPGALHCHCDEASLKLADLTGTEVANPHFPTFVSCPWIGEETALLGNRPSRLGSRAPPGNGTLPFHLRREVSCAYLL